MTKLIYIKDALPKAHFAARARRACGTERMETWAAITHLLFPIGVDPTNIVEECISKLYALVRPGPNCIGGMCWATQIGRRLAFHTDGIEAETPDGEKSSIPCGQASCT